MHPDRYESWGRFPKVCRQEVRSLRFRSDPLPEAEGPLLPYGLGRSYGDSCLNEGGTLLSTTNLDRLIHFDHERGILRCEAGVSLAEILRLTVPRGWFLPVTPGTKFVTLGGAIANDVHGKNHHADGTFGRHVRCFEVLRSDGTRHLCSPEENAGLFRATIGGLGLTGVVTWAEFQLRPVSNPLIEAESVRIRSLDEFYEVNAASEADYRYTVAWIDVLASGRNLGRGLYNRGNHAAPVTADLPKLRWGSRLAVPLDAPGWAINPLTVRAFNFAYYHKQLRRVQAGLLPYEPFFYPLDAVAKWNRVYGKRGFFQYQCVVPTGSEAMREIIRTIARSAEASPLVVLKTFGDLPSPGMLSFPRQGITLALDFPNRGERTFRLFEELDRLVADAGGALYPAKDARMPPAMFQRSFPRWREFATYVDPRFSSSFWRRVTHEF
ncbi:FAD-dependent oxidoreductase [Vulgatibacter sp.]|uniref:FAD-binding oxidoreductase n=1 Tax=Vulgatibacter sp. TaxID=1971226 RepID=UPI0035663B8B